MLPTDAAALWRPTLDRNRTARRQDHSGRGRTRFGRYAPIRSLRAAVGRAGRQGRSCGPAVAPRAVEIRAGCRGGDQHPSRASRTRFFRAAAEPSARFLARLSRACRRGCPILRSIRADWPVAPLAAGRRRLANWHRLVRDQKLCLGGATRDRAGATRAAAGATALPFRQPPAGDRHRGPHRYWRRRPDIVHFGTQLGDFADTAAIVAELDLVISIDTAVAHLAGALAKPVWLLLPFVADFRWLRDRRDSPWYPTARLFRQPAPGDWDSVIAEVAAELGRFSARRSGRV